MILFLLTAVLYAAATECYGGAKAIARIRKTSGYNTPQLLGKNVPFPLVVLGEIILVALTLLLFIGVFEAQPFMSFLEMSLFGFIVGNMFLYLLQGSTQNLGI